MNFSQSAFAAFLQELQPSFSPLFLPDLNQGNTLLMDFSRNNPDMALLDFTDTELLDRYVSNKIVGSCLTYGYGGYMEDRAVYARSKVFDTEAGSRNIHLGVDIWAETETPVFAPLNARVHSFGNNSSTGDYGPTIILQHTEKNQTFYTLYGHLTLDSLEGLSEGMLIKKGAEFCRIGDFPTNGDWPPHLHFQIIEDMMGKMGDFPGVCTSAEKEKYSKICPDPIVFFPAINYLT